MQVDGGVIAAYLKSVGKILLVGAVADLCTVHSSLREAYNKIRLKVYGFAAHVHIRSGKESGACLIVAVFAAALDGQDGEIIAVRFAVIQSYRCPSLRRRKLKVALRAQKSQLH